MLTVFIVITGENWNEVMHNTCNKFGPFYSIYFISIVICGNFMLLNLFLAILLKYIDEMNTEYDHIKNEALKTARKNLVVEVIQGAVAETLAANPTGHLHA